MKSSPPKIKPFQGTLPSGLGTAAAGRIEPDVILCEICLEEHPAGDIRECPSCATDVCVNCRCEICHGPAKPEGVLDDGEAAGGDDDFSDSRQVGYLPSHAEIAMACEIIRSEWPEGEAELRRGGKLQGFMKSEIEEFGQWSVPTARTPDLLDPDWEPF